MERAVSLLDSIPKGFQHKAQGFRTLGGANNNRVNPSRGCVYLTIDGHEQYETHSGFGHDAGIPNPGFGNPGLEDEIPSGLVLAVMDDRQYGLEGRGIFAKGRFVVVVLVGLRRSFADLSLGR